MSLPNEKTIPSIFDLNAWPKFIREHPLPDLNVTNIDPCKAFLDANPPWKLIKAFTEVRRLRKRMPQIENYLAVAVNLSIARAVRSNVKASLPNKGSDIVEDTTRMLFEIALQPETNAYNWLLYTFHKYIPMKVADVYKKRRKERQIFIEPPEIGELHAESGTEAIATLSRAMNLMPPAVRQSFDNLIHGRDDAGVSVEALKVRRRRAKEIVMREFDIGFVEGFFTETTGLEHQLRHEPDPDAIAVCLLAFTASFPFGPTHADIEKWCAEFTEFEPHIRSHAKAMEIFPAEGENPDLELEDVIRVLKHTKRVIS